MNTPVQALAWSCHAATTIKDAKGNVLAECSGNGRYSEEDELIAAEIVKRINCFDELLQAAQDFVAWAERSGLHAAPDSPVGKARDAIAKAGGAA